MSDQAPTRQGLAFPDGLPLVRPWLPDPERLEQRLAEVVGGAALTNGPRVRDLERAVQERIGDVNVVAVSSCTAGLMLVYRALGIRGDVVLPSFTFAASAHAVAWAGGSPVWGDIEPDALTLDPDDVAARITDRTAAVSATHIYGAPARVEELTQAAASANVPLVFDAAHALGSSHHGVPIGSSGTAEVFSLSPTKVVVAGEGGLVATRDAELAEKIRIGRDYGNPGDYNCRFIGLNARMSELHATVALHSLALLDEALDRRNALVETFAKRVAGVNGLRLQALRDGDVSTYKDLTLVLDPELLGLDVPAVAERLSAQGVETRRYYHPPIHRMQAYEGLPPVTLPVTDDVAPRVITLPLWTHMSEDTVARLADVLLDALEEPAS